MSCLLWAILVLIFYVIVVSETSLIGIFFEKVKVYMKLRHNVYVGTSWNTPTYQVIMFDNALPVILAENQSHNLIIGRGFLHLINHRSCTLDFQSIAHI